ncbi:MAG: hypothetical protein ACFNTA_06560 [Campylobacter sp.]|uniref:hypothetical protein n=1 Tax=Campylobacter sp. TaxID=205 RepID=UPI0036230F63
MSYPHVHAAQKVENQAVEVLETKQLREATASAPAVVAKKISIAPLLRKLGFTAVGVTLTAANTRMQQMKGGRYDNKKIAEHLAQSLKELCVFLNAMSIPCTLEWVYEKHENGSPHIHCILFVPLALREFLTQKVAEYIGKDGISSYPKICYMLKQLTKSRKLRLDISRKTKYSDEEQGKRYECSKIKGVQKEKMIRFMQNELMTRNYPETAAKLREMMEKIDAYYKKHRTGKREKRHTAIRKYDVTLFDFVLYPTSEAENKAQARAKTHARAKETAEVKQIQIGEIGENGEIKIVKKPKKSSLNIYLKAKNGEKLHIAGRNISVSAEDVRQIKRKCRKMRDKKQMTKLALVWKSQKAKPKIEGEQQQFDETFFMSLDFEQIAQPTSEPPKIT